MNYLSKEEHDIDTILNIINRQVLNEYPESIVRPAMLDTCL